MSGEGELPAGGPCRAPGLRGFLERHLERGTFPGAVFLVAEGERILAEGWGGWAVREPEARRIRRDTIFDLSSLTKPLATAFLTALLCQDGFLRPSDRVREFFPEFSGDGREDVRIEDLLLHRGGLPDWMPLYLAGGGREGMFRRLLGLPLSYVPRTRVVYSCPGYILLGEVLKKVTGKGLRELFQTMVAGPLGLRDTCFLPPRSLRPRIAATERGNRWERSLAGPGGKDYAGWRQGILWGEVHDGNAHGLGGVGGNAGLFSSAPEVLRVAREFVGSGLGLLSEEWRDRFRRNGTEGMEEARSPGWQLSSTPGSAGHGSLPEGSFGHTGFTGVSLWIEPRRGRIYILLTNRVHPEVRPVDMNEVRREFHGLAREVGS